MKDSKLTMDFKFSGLMEPEFNQRLKNSKSFINVNGNLMKQEYCQNQILLSFLDLKSKIKHRNLKNFSSMEKVQLQKIAPSSK